VQRRNQISSVRRAAILLVRDDGFRGCWPWSSVERFLLAKPDRAGYTEDSRTSEVHERNIASGLDSAYVRPAA
jgi:hypothetical protein